MKGFTTGFLHHKYAIVDAEPLGYTPYVITGSHNWSSSAENRNDENTLIIQDDGTANYYLQEFAARYYEAGGTDSIEIVTSVEYESGIDDTTGGKPDTRRIDELAPGDFVIPDTTYIPGVASMVDGISKAYKPDIIMRASNKQIPNLNYAHALAEAQPIPNMTTADDPEHRGWGELMPVYTSDNGDLKVFAFLVDHYPCFP